MARGHRECCGVAPAWRAACGARGSIRGRWRARSDVGVDFTVPRTSGTLTSTAPLSMPGGTTCEVGVKLLQFVAMVLTALALVPGGAHLFALPNKISLSESDYFIAQS